MRRQYSRPFVVRGTSAHGLTRNRIEVGNDQGLTESWLQEFIFDHPGILPIEEIEPVFNDLVPLCRELPTGAGPLDLLFGSPSGLLTLVECKLWKNPEARRTVIGQILDYAKELSRWSYDDLQQAISRAGGPPDLYRALAVEGEDLDEATFIDNVSRYLRLGRFLLLIVGEGIRESVEEISAFLQTHAHLNFSFALVETAIFSLPDALGGGLLVNPRVLCRTVEIERAVVRLEADRVVVDSAPAVEPGRSATRPRRTVLSEQLFYESLDVPPATAAGLKEFLDKAQGLGLVLQSGSNSLMLKSDDGEFNFAVFRVNGTMQNRGIAKRTQDLGFPEVGERYLDRLAALFDRGQVDRSSPRPFRWSVKKDGRDITIEECVAVHSEWLDLLRDTIGEIDAAMG